MFDRARAAWQGSRTAICVILGAALAVLVLSAGPALAGPAAAPPLPVVCDSFAAVTSPNNGTQSNTLMAIAVIAPDDAWAVGQFAGASADQTLTEHWDGSTWTLVPSPNVGTGNNVLQGVTAVNGNDVWAAGYYADASFANHTLIEHWNGSVWALATSADPGTGNNFLSAVTALAPNDVWAVGFYNDNPGPEQTLTEHWNGTTWTAVPSPNVSTIDTHLAAVSGTSPTDVWAVGAYDNASGTYQTLILHWNGSTWAIAGSQNAGSDNNYLTGVTAIAPNDAWAVGYSLSGGVQQTLTEHWNGSAWSIIPSPSVGAQGSSLNAVAAGGPNDVWAAGSSANGLVVQNLALHWDGSAWSIVPTEDVGADSNGLNGVATAGGAVWVAGYSTGAGSVRQTLTERYTPCPGTPSPTPSAPSPTPTLCPVTFSDVHPTDYFYQPVLYLACNGVISGYADGTFRPYNNTTRAQQVKIVVLGFGKPIVTPTPSGAYTFTDVAPGAPFFDVIETAAADGIVSGYACGGPGEPCDPQHRAYFRPNANVTRGQLSKIDVIAAGWAQVNPATGTFEDVIPGSPFYQVVETAAAHGVISGYACGGPGEPCDAGHRPYFRPGNSATRGQIAKIVYLSITGP